MHLKSYQIDGRLLRTGSANFSGSGLKSLTDTTPDVIATEIVDNLEAALEQFTKIAA